MENNIDLTKLEPIPYKNTIAVLNEYVIQNIDFLNKFGHFNENQLFEMEVVLDEIESKVMLLEKKLDSVPADMYNGVVLPAPGQQYVAPPQIDHNLPEPQAAAPQQVQQPQQQTAQPQEQQQQEQQAAPQEPEEQPKEEPVVDERLAKFIKLLSYGVPVAQLKIKMTMEGLDPNTLDPHIV